MFLIYKERNSSKTALKRTKLEKRETIDGSNVVSLVDLVVE